MKLVKFFLNEAVDEGWTGSASCRMSGFPFAGCLATVGCLGSSGKDEFPEGVLAGLCSNTCGEECGVGLW